MSKVDLSYSVLGHDSVLKTLDAIMPADVMLIGPRSVGKKMIFEQMVRTHDIDDVIRVTDFDDASMQEIKKASTEGTETVKMIFIRLGFPSTKLVEKLLKVVEDAPESVKFFVTSVADPGFTLSSRFSVFRVGFLSNANVGIILTRMGYAPDKAAKLAARGFGTISTAVFADKSIKDIILVKQALSFIANKQEDDLDNLYKKWKNEHTELIRVWAVECITERSRMFKTEDLRILSKGTAIKILKKINSFDRPRYVVRSSLVSIIREEQS